MQILVVGGTKFVGRHLGAAARGRGHEVTVLHRGVDCSGAPGAEHLHADRDGDLSILADRHWDATADVCAYWPRQVTHLADALGERGGRHLLVSTVSVYADPHEPGLDEQAPLLAPLGLDGDRPALTMQTYGPLKVGCEHVAEQRHGGALLVVRPTIVVGPNDVTGRFPTWVARLARGGRVLLPGNPLAPAQQVDVRDLATFMVHLLEAGDEGIVHVVAPEPPFTRAEQVEAIRRAVAPEGTTLEWVESAWLHEQGVTPATLPLWSGSDDPDFVLALDPARAIDAGLRARPLEESAQDTLTWLGQVSVQEGTRGMGLPAEREAELLRAWASRPR